MIPPEALIPYTIFVLTLGGYIGWAARSLSAMEAAREEMRAIFKQEGTILPQEQPTRTLEPVAAWSGGDYFCAAHAPSEEHVTWINPWSEVAPEQCAKPGCQIEVLALAQHRLAPEELPLALERFMDLPPVAQDRVRAVMDNVGLGTVRGCEVCGELEAECYCDGSDAIAVLHEVGDHSRCSIWCDEKLGQINLT